MISCTVDSGTETLFSDESPCELTAFPSICSGDETQGQNEESENATTFNSKLPPQNILPYSGVLEKGKVVVRPIAFKPYLPKTTHSNRSSDRYGSTPILARPGSRLTLYGSTNDLYTRPNAQHYPLDRNVRSSSSSAISSPAIAMSSLRSTPYTHELLNYDSLESVRKSPRNNINCSIINEDLFNLSASHMENIMDLTSSPSDSGISELEAALRDRDSELTYLRQTMEHNEQVIFRVYQEKEKAWEREIHRLKSVHESRLRATAEKALKLEQFLIMQSFQHSQDKKDLIVKVQTASLQNDELIQEVDVLRSRLEETEWSLCQKTGEIALLKTQLKECQMEQTSKCQELLQLRTDFREFQHRFEELEDELNKQKMQYVDRNKEIFDLQAELEDLRFKLRKYESIQSIDKTSYEDISEKDRLKAEIKELREELSDLLISDYSHIQPGRLKPQMSQIEFQNFENQEGCESLNDLKIEDLNEDHTEPFDVDNEVEQLRRGLKIKNAEFEREKLIWTQEKENVLRYQRKLELNYVQIYRRCKALEVEVESLTLNSVLPKSYLKYEGVGEEEIS